MTTKQSRTQKRANAKTLEPELLTSLGFQVRAFGPLPKDFDPLTATARQLSAHRLPRRPDSRTEPELHALWERTLSRTKVWITPEFEYMERITHGGARKSRNGHRNGSNGSNDEVRNATSTNWSGATAFSPADKPYTFVGGQWTVPSPHSAAIGSYFASEWVGIDGWNSGDVLQAGTETAISNFSFFEATQVYTWWEWFPAGEVKISNLPVSPGDVMYCLICADTKTHATVYFSNQSTGVGTRFEITPPSGTTLVGNVAEWIVERPTVNGSVANLTDYAACYFDECIAGGSGRVDNLSGASLVTMTGTGGATLSEPVRENSSVLKVNWRKSS